MKAEDMTKELWSLANGITAFSVAQSLAVAITLGTTLHERLQLAPTPIKLIIVLITLAYGSVYCFAVYRCWKMDRTEDARMDAIWRETTIGRIASIYIFNGIFIFGLFAPDLYH